MYPFDYFVFILSFIPKLKMRDGKESGRAWDIMRDYEEMGKRE